MEEEKVFTVKFHCNNCGHNWHEEFCRGDIIHDGIRGVVAPRVEDHRCTRSFSCPYCRNISCPICGAEEEVIIVERKPLLWKVKTRIL